MKKHIVALFSACVMATGANAENIQPHAETLFDKGVCVGKKNFMGCQYRQVIVDMTGIEWLDKELLSVILGDKPSQATNSTISELKQRILQHYQQELDDGAPEENGKKLTKPKYVLNSVDDYHHYLDKYEVASVGRFSKVTEIKFVRQKGDSVTFRKTVSHSYSHHEGGPSEEEIKFNLKTKKKTVKVIYAVPD